MGAGYEKIDLDQLTRQDVWRTQLPLPPNVSGKKLGIIGLGGIGEKVALRAQAFEMQIGYHNRRPHPGSPHRYFPSVGELAGWPTFCSSPSGAAIQRTI